MNELTPELMSKLLDASKIHPTSNAEWSVLGLLLILAVAYLGRLAVNLVNRLIEAKSQVEVVIANNTTAMHEIRTELVANRNEIAANREATDENREAIRDLREYLAPRVPPQRSRSA